MKDSTAKCITPPEATASASETSISTSKEFSIADMSRKTNGWDCTGYAVSGIQRMHVRIVLHGTMTVLRNAVSISY